MIVDFSSQYPIIQDRNPELITQLGRLKHSKEFVHKIYVDDELINMNTNRLDGSFAFLRKFWNKHMVSQLNTYRYTKEFEFRYGTWSKSQNALERLLHYMRIPFDISVIKGPELAEPWFDISNSKSQYYYHD